MEMFLRESLMKRNEDLTKELVDANEKLAKFNKSSTMLDEQIQSQRMNGDTTRLGYNTFEEGESPSTKDNMHEGKPTPKIHKPTGKKSYKPICFHCHKPKHTANVCRSKSDVANGYRPNAYQVYKPRTFNDYHFTCNMHRHRVVECRYGGNNQAPHMSQRSSGGWQRTFNDQRSSNWQRPYANRSSPYEMEKRMNVVCTICHNYGHVAMSYIRRTDRGYVGPWRASSMACYHCHKSRHIAKFCREKVNQP